jgi:DNA-binding transcriptional MerR regulator
LEQRHFPFLVLNPFASNFNSRRRETVLNDIKPMGIERVRSHPNCRKRPEQTFTHFFQNSLDQTNAATFIKISFQMCGAQFVSSQMQFLSPSKAARRLGVSVKALRIYEQRGFMTPTHTEAGWRSYGPAEMQRAGEMVALRALGLSLAQVASVLEGEAEGLEPALALHQSVLEGDARRLADTIERVRGLRASLD